VLGLVWGEPPPMQAFAALPSASPATIYVMTPQSSPVEVSQAEGEALDAFEPAR